MPSPKSLSKRKVNPKNVLTKSRKNSNTTPWLKNAMRTLGQNSLEVFRDISPNIYDVVETSTKSAVSVAREIKSGNTTRSVTDSISNNKFIKAGKTAIKNSIEDLKKGNFNNTEREDQAMAAYMGMDGDDWDDFGTFFDDWDADGGDDGTAVQINNFTDNSGTVAITDEMRRGSIAQLQGQKANIDSMIAVSSAHMLQQQEISNQILGKLDNITSSIGALIEFNNSVMQNYIDSQMAYMERMGGMVEEYTSGGGNDGVDPQSVFRDANGGINTRNYINLVKEQAKKTFRNSMVGSLNDLVDEDMLNTMVANPLQGVSKLAIKAALPKVLKNSAKQLDEAVAGFIPTLLAKFATQGDVFSFNAKDSILNTFAKILGVRQGKESKFDLSNRFTGKVAHFDDITRHSITEVIPGYLRDSTAYLRDIAKALGVNDKHSRDTARVFDYQNGQYRTMQNLKEDVMTTIDQSGIEAINRTRFGKKMRALGSFGTFGDQAAYDNALDEFFRRLEENGKFIDITNMSDGSDLDAILKAGKYSPNMQNRLRAALQEINTDKSLALNANAAVMKARFARNNTIKSMNEDPDRYGLYSITDNREIDKQVADVVNKTIGTPAESKKIGTVSSILSDVRYLLNRGIDVRIAGHGTYGSIDSFDNTASGTPRNSVIDRARDTISNVANQAKYRFTGEETEYYDADGNYAEDPNKRPESVAKQRERMQREIINTDEEQTKYAKLGTDFMHALVFGSGREASSVLAKAASVKFGDIGKKFNEDFLEPMKESVFGKKDERGYERAGLLSGIQNKFVDSYKEFVRQFNGKGYVDSTGKTVDPKGDNEQTVVGNLKSMVHEVKDSFMDYVFGKKDENGKRQKANTLLGKVTGAFDEGLKGWKAAIFGETDKDGNPVDINMKDITDRIKSALPATITGGMMGAAGAMSLGGSVLGTIVGGPLTGAVIGSIGGILSQSDKFKNWLFGDLGEDGERKDNGFISKGVQDFFKKNKTEIVGGAALGALKQAIFPNSAVGLLGHLVGGPLAGAILGAGVGIVKKSDFFQEFLYGKEGSWHKGIIPMFNSIFKKKDSNGEDTGETSGLKIAGMTGIGAAGGALTGALVSSMGLIPACMTPMGPIGGAVVGVAAALKASQKGIHSYLFGSDDKDKYGLKNIGVLQKFGNMLDVELFQPMKNGLANFIEDSRNFIIDKMLAPVEFAVEPMVAAFKNVADDIGNRIKSVTDSVGEYIRGKILDPIVESARKFIITPMRRISGFFFKAFTGLAKSIIAAPFNALAVLTNFNNARDKRDSRRRVMQENRDSLTGAGFLDNLAIRFHYGDAYKKAGWKYSKLGTEEAQQYDERRQLYEEDRKKRKAEAKQNRIDRKNSEFNRQMIARATGNKLKEDTEENRRIAQQMLNDGRRNNMVRKWGKTIKWKGDRFYDNMEDPRNQQVSSSSLSNDNLAKNSNDPKADTASRSLGFLIKIYDAVDRISGGHGYKGKEKGNGLIPKRQQIFGRLGSVQGNQEPEEEKKLKPNEETSGAMLHLLTGAVSAAADVPGQIDAAKEVVDRKIRGILGNIHIPFFAKGGKTTEDTLAVVGEKGPEVVTLPGGTTINPNDRALHVIVDKFDNHAINTLENVSAVSRDYMPHDQGESADAEAAYENAKKRGSYEEQKKRADEEKKDKETKEFQNKLLENTGEAKENQKKHFSIWNTIFSKKGILTGLALVAGNLLNKFLKKFLNIDIPGAIGSAVATALGTAGKDFYDGLHERTDGDTTADRLNENIQEMGDAIKNVDPVDWVVPNGNLDHASGAKFNAILHSGKYAKMFASTNIGKDVIGGVKAVGTVTNRIPQYIANSGVAKTFKGAAATTKNAVALHKAGGIGKFADAAKSKMATGATWSKASTEAASDMGVKLATSGEKSTATITGLISKSINAIVTKLTEFLAKHGINGSNKLVAFGEKVVGKLKGFGTKISRFFTAAAPVIDAAIIVLSGINGATGAKRLFQIDADPDWKMIAISTVFGAFKGTTVGSILDMVNATTNDILGFDFFHELALLAYNLFSSKDEYAKLTQNIDDFKSRYNDNKEKEIKDSYSTYCAVYGIDPSTFSFEDYKKCIEDGTVKATTTSYADYNAKEHQTIGSKTYNALKNSVVGKIAGKAKTFLFGEKNVSYVDNQNRKWVEDKSNPGHYLVYNATTGERLGTTSMASEYVPQDATKVDTSKKGIFAKGIGAIGRLLSPAKTTVDTYNQYTKDAVEMSAIAKDGDMEKLANYETDNVLAKNILQYQALTNKTATQTGKYITSTLDDGKRTDKNIQNFVKSAKKYADPSTNLNDFNKLTYGNSKDYPIDGLVGPMTKGIMNTYLQAVRSVGTTGTAIAATYTTSNGTRLTNTAHTTGYAAFANGGRGGDDGLPYFSQNDPRWANMKYGDETMSQAGCGPNAFAMVANALGGARGGVTPVDVAKYAEEKGYRDETGTNWNFVDNASRDYGLNSSKEANPDSGFVSSQLNQGHPVILSGQGGAGTPYTTGGHYIVATGKDSDGNVNIKDPRGPQYSGKYPMKVVTGGANMAWGISKGGRGNRKISNKVQNFKVINGGRGSDPDMKNGFPFLLQGDARWGNTQYSSSGDTGQTIKSSGCGVTCMAMVLRSFNNDVTPIDTAQYALTNSFRTKNTGTSWDFFPSISKKYGLTCNNLGTSISKVRDALSKGYPVIASMKPGTFTQGGHFIVLVGTDQNGNVLVNDPASAARSNASYAISVFSKEAKNFWSFSANGKGSIGETYTTTPINLSSNGTTYSEVNVSEGSPMDFLSTLGSFFSQVASKSWSYIMTGTYDKNWDFSGNSTNDSTGSSVYTPGTSGALNDIELGNNEVTTYNYFKNKGFSDAATFGLMGNIKQESHFDPTLLQYPSQRAAGLFQWQDYKNKSERWKNLDNYAKSRGTAWTDLGTQLDFANSEMNAGKWRWEKGAKSGLDNVTSFDQYKQMGDAASAAIAFANHFERCADPGDSRRQQYALEYEQAFKNGVSVTDGANGTASVSKNSIKAPNGSFDMLRDTILNKNSQKSAAAAMQKNMLLAEHPELSALSVNNLTSPMGSAVMTAQNNAAQKIAAQVQTNESNYRKNVASQYGAFSNISIPTSTKVTGTAFNNLSKYGGGKGGDDESIPFANVTRNLPKRDKTTVIGTDINSKSSRYTGSTRGGRGDNYEKYFELIIKYLADITSNSADANTKLEMLKNIKNISINKTSVNAGGRGGESKTIVVNKPSEQISTPAPSRTESIARKLAAGF